MTITSPHNEHLKQLRKLHRPRGRAVSGRFVAEGEDLVAAADAAGWAALERYCAAGSGLPGTEVEPRLLDAASTLGSGTRTLAVYEQRWASAATGPLCVALWGVGDPGNVGAVLRSALAFGAASVALGPGCADPWSPKAVRASMGAVFEVALARVAGVDELPGPRLALAAGWGEPLRGRLAAGSLVIGAERTGLPRELVAACDRAVHIPIASESLNAAMAATVALYEVTRATGPRGADVPEAPNRDRTDASVPPANPAEATPAPPEASS
ncbi:MAG: methyltransferase, TrmH family [Solirubrobacteraceae bacterium]|jgi:TrmH family RNA methyltransferase|nr:methyltransferase, TrmH family [Solirubrobacteraceae bacterium]